MDGVVGSGNKEGVVSSYVQNSPDGCRAGQKADHRTTCLLWKVPYRCRDGDKIREGTTTAWKVKKEIVIQ